MALNDWSATVRLSDGVGKLGYAQIKMDRPTSSPQVKRRKRQLKRLPVFLAESMWQELSYAAEFATEAFKLTGRPETVSRNDFIEDSLIWALAAYWQDKGGRPTSTAEFKDRAKAYAEKLKKQEQ
jgi:hypothetical protein